MSLSEDNQANQIGILPSKKAGPIPAGKIPDGGTQVAKDEEADGSEVTIHTVTSQTTLYLCTLILTTLNGSGSASAAYMIVTTAADSERYRFCYIYTPNNDGRCCSAAFSPPLEIAAGWKVKVYSSATDNKATGFIFGYEA